MEPTKESIDTLVEWVRFLFDQVVSSMDWGSGFLDTEEVLKVLAIAEFLGVDCGAPAFEFTPGEANLGEQPAWSYPSSPEYDEWHRRYQEEYERQEAEHRRDMHELAHQVLLRSGLPRAANLTPGDSQTATGED